MLKSVFELPLFYKKNVSEKLNLFKISKGRYFLPGGRTDIIFDTCFETFK